MQNQESLKEIQEIIGYNFLSKDLLSTALTHRSSLNEKGVKESNERLEFLGDAVLELIITDFLFHAKPNEAEGVLTTARSAIVRTDSLSRVAQDINLGKYLIMSKGEISSGGRQNPSILENAIEALIGAIYKDSGIDSAASFVERFIVPRAKELLNKNELKDPKSRLQEKVQSQGKTSPTYRVVSEIGPDHIKTFTVSVQVDGVDLATGTGKSKQEAEQSAAEKAINLI